MKPENKSETDTYSYMFSHDLKEPLRMITTYLHLLERDHKGELSDQGSLLLDYALKGADRLDRMFTDLLAYTSIQQKKLEKIDLNLIISDIIETLKHVITEVNAEITVSTLPVVTADKVHLIQLFQNLISNSLKFCSFSNPCIQVKWQETEKSQIFSVRDNGIGIPLKYSEKIFGMFKRLHTPEEYPGSGIGLAISRDIVMQYNGTITAVPVLSGGTEIVMEFPSDFCNK